LIGTRPVEDLVDSETLETLKNAMTVENQGVDKAPLELERQLREKIHAYYYESYSRTQQDVQSRWAFEQAIKRAYFHVTELEETELENWRKYLDFEEKQGDFHRTCFLYERCLVACALYDEFWLRYARWMFSQGREEDTRIIYMRASCVFVPISAPTIRLNWARFEEKLGRISVARDIHVAILDQAPEFTETIISLAGVERRHEGNDAAVRLLDEYIQHRNSQIGGVLAAEQARILWQCKGSVDEARQVFKDKYPQFLDCRDFWVKYMQFEAAQPSTDHEEAHARVKAVHELMRTKGSFPSETSKYLSEHYMEYLLNRGGKDAAEEYMLLDKEVNGYVSSAKSDPSQSLPSKRKKQPHNAANKRQRK
jgi:pre-mRNA-processing factor 39